MMYKMISPGVMAGAVCYHWLLPVPTGVITVGPVVVWLIAASTALFGDSALAVCLPAVVLETWRSWFVFLLARAHVDYGRCVSGWQRIPNACESRG